MIRRLRQKKNNNLLRKEDHFNMKTMTVSNRVIEAYELYFRKNGEKRNVILNSHNEVNNFKSKLKRNKRKYLGSRKIRLVEVIDD